MVALAVSGCVGGGQPSQARTGRSSGLGDATAPSRLETVAYDWKANRVTVSFYRQLPGEPWRVTVRDSWDILDQSTKTEGKLWGVSECRCSTQECLRIIEQSLARFSAERPGAKVEFLAMEMQVSRELWGAMLVGLSRTLATLPGEKASNRIDVPDEIDGETARVLDSSPAIAAIKALLKKRGMAVQSVGIAEHILFRDSLAGRRWSDIAALPDVGVLVPGTVEFDAAESGIKPAAESGVMQPAPSQSAQR